MEFDDLLVHRYVFDFFRPRSRPIHLERALEVSKQNWATVAPWRTVTRIWIQRQLPDDLSTIFHRPLLCASAPTFTTCYLSCISNYAIPRLFVMGGTVCLIIRLRAAPCSTLTDVVSLRILVGKVYHALMAIDKSKPRKFIALKKARTTGLVTNPVLRHEACVLLRLRRRSFAIVRLSMLRTEHTYS